MTNIDKETYLIAQMFGVSRQTLYQRIHVHGWSVKKACFTPIKKKVGTHFTKEQIKIAEQNDIPLSNVRARLRIGWDVKRAIRVPVRTQDK